MAEISLLQPTVLRGVVERFTAPETLTLLNSVPQTPHPYPSVAWEITNGSRNIALPNVPNSEAHIVDQSGRRAMSASFVYLREKKVFTPTTLHWLKQAETNGNEMSRANAEQAVMREVQDLNTRFDNFAEWTLWRALSGKLDFKTLTGNSYVTNEVDYGFQASHRLDKLTTGWSSATPTQIIADIRALKARVERDGGVPVTDAFVSATVMDKIFDSFATSGSNLLSDRMKDQYYGSGRIDGFMGINWKVQNAVFDATGSSYTATPTIPSQETRFLDENSLVLGNLSTNRPIELYVGPTADDEAPVGFTGKFAKTWKEKDPSARQYLLEWNILPVVTRPDQFVYVKDVLA